LEHLFFELQSGNPQIICKDMTLHTSSKRELFINDFLNMKSY
jgi:hypothetical protein